MKSLACFPFIRSRNPSGRPHDRSAAVSHASSPVKARVLQIFMNSSVLSEIPFLLPPLTTTLLDSRKPPVKNTWDEKSPSFVNSPTVPSFNDTEHGCEKRYVRRNKLQRQLTTHRTQPLLQGEMQCTQDQRTRSFSFVLE